MTLVCVRCCFGVDQELGPAFLSSRIVLASPDAPANRRHGLHAVEQLRRRDSERSGKPADSAEAGLSHRALQLPDLAGVEVTAVPKVLLGEAEPLPVRAEVRGELPSLVHA